jgi:ATP-binding cassette subfamily C protein EexD
VFRHSLRTPKAGIQSAQLQSAQPLRDLDSVRTLMTGPGLFAIADAPWVPISVGLLFVLHPWYGYYGIIVCLVMFALGVSQEYGTRKEIVAATTHTIMAMRFVDVNLRNGEAVEAMGMSDGMYKRWEEKHEAAMRLQSSASDWAGWIVASSKFWQATMQIFSLGIGAYLVLENQMTPGGMIAASVILGKGVAPISIAVSTWPQFVNARSAYGRLIQLLSANPIEPRRMSLPAPTGALSVEQLFVAPPGAQIPVVRNVSFDLKPGEMLGVIGPSAAGKSTLVRAILGVWQAQAGSVRLDGAALGHWNRDELGSFIGYLPQDVELFDGTVAENIARMGEVDADGVVRAAKTAGVHDMILGLPHGYDTHLGDGGATLSGGQRQRIGLARALYGDPVLIVLDEPNSNLDQAGEYALSVAMDELRKRGCTTIVVTHRVNVLSSMHKILVMNNGMVEKLGPCEEVLASYMRPVAVPGGPAPAAPPASIASGGPA